MTAAAAALGVLAGIVFARLWLRVVPWRVHGTFWSGISALTRELVRAEEAGAFLRLYRRLLAGVARYVGRNLAGTVVAGLPLAALLAAAPFLLEEGEAPFFIAFVAAMTAAFLWPAHRY